MAPSSMPASAPKAAFTVSIVSHRQAALCATLIDDLSRVAPASVAKLVLTVNVPEALPSLGGLPFAVEVIRNERPKGFAENHNHAVTHCTAQFFAVMNPDLRIETDPFPALAAHLADAAVGIVAPVVREADGSVADFARPLVSPWEVLRRRIGIFAAPADLARPDWIAGMFMAFRSQVFRDMGGFDTRYFLYCEDVDICARARLRGLRLEIAREVSVTHLARRESHRSPHFLWRHISSLWSFWASPAYRDYRALLRAEASASAKGP